MMKIAIPTKHMIVDEKLTLCEFITIFTILSNKTIAEEKLNIKEECDSKKNLYKLLKLKGVNIMLVGRITPEEAQELSTIDIRIIQGCSGPIADVAKKFMTGKLK